LRREWHAVELVLLSVVRGKSGMTGKAPGQMASHPPLLTLPDVQVMGGDISPDGSYTLATSGYDRTVKLFAPDVLRAL
jgi:hypothetical protein